MNKNNVMCILYNTVKAFYGIIKKKKQIHHYRLHKLQLCFYFRHFYKTTSSVWERKKEQ